ncbi:MAG: hypothetical protein GWN58_33690 [Anaerolineae bacterium]|nr:hypothetical protein [Thermoplasmata archaeon]NIV34231.1 hypothetical protein [Anaerolineae bacterium]NIY06079.1 hypothetical protein [Thermoplasmata archaeon]
MTTTDKPQRPKKKLPPDARAIASLALLLEGIEDDRFEEGLAAVIDNLKPRIKQAWTERRLKKEVYDPLTAAVQTGDVRKVITAIVTNGRAVQMINELHAEHQRAPAAA